MTPTQLLFGRDPTTVLLQTSDNFDGSTPVVANSAVITEGVATFPPISGGGLYNFQKDPIVVQSIDFYGSGTLSIYKKSGSLSVLLGTLGGSNPNTYSQPILLMPSQSLSFISTGSGSKTAAITASLTLEANISGSSSSSGGGGSSPTLKAGTVASGSFSGSPQTASVVFGTAFTGAYVVVLTGGDSRLFTVENQTDAGFTINANSNGALTSDVNWFATPVGET
jgi:hypothetical protein